MGMVDRYKKPGGFVQLLQVIETCNPKKREQFMGIITEESPQWAEALNQKCLSFDKIISWKAEVLLDIAASVNTLSFTAALKSLSPEALEAFLQKVSNQDRKKFENSLKESNPNPNEIAASVMKVINETRNMMVKGQLKADRVDPQLAIPEDFEAMLEKGGASVSAPLSFDGPGAALNFDGPGGNDSELKKKLTLLQKEVQVLKQENQVMKDKLEKIKKIA